MREASDSVTRRSMLAIDSPPSDRHPSACIRSRRLCAHVAFASPVVQAKTSSKVSGSLRSTWFSASTYARYVSSAAANASASLVKAGVGSARLRRPAWRTARGRSGRQQEGERGSDEAGFHATTVTAIGAQHPTYPHPGSRGSRRPPRGTRSPAQRRTEWNRPSRPPGAGHEERFLPKIPPVSQGGRRGFGSHRRLALRRLLQQSHGGLGGARHGSDVPAERTQGLRWPSCGQPGNSKSPRADSAPAVSRAPVGSKAMDTTPARSELGAMLGDLRAEALHRVESLDASMADLRADRSVDTADDEHDPEGVTLSTEWARLAGLRQAAERELAEIDEASGAVGCRHLRRLHRLRSRHPDRPASGAPCRHALRRVCGEGGCVTCRSALRHPVPARVRGS